MARGHPLGLFEPLGPTFGLEILEVPNVVYLNASLRAAHSSQVSAQSRSSSSGRRLLQTLGG